MLKCWARAGSACTRTEYKVILAPPRPSFIVSTADVAPAAFYYPDSTEPHGPRRAIGKAAGLVKIGLHVTVVPPGTRVSRPHAEEREEEFVLVLEGELDAWVDGHLHRVRAGDLVAFPAGTGICHTFINNRSMDARVLVGGEATRDDNRIYYPLDVERRHQIAEHEWWSDIPLAPQGPHDGLPDAQRGPM